MSDAGLIPSLPSSQNFKLFPRHCHGTENNTHNLSYVVELFRLWTDSWMGRNRQTIFYFYFQFIYFSFRHFCSITYIAMVCLFQSPRQCILRPFWVRPHVAFSVVSGLATLYKCVDKGSHSLLLSIKSKSSTFVSRSSFNFDFVWGALSDWLLFESTGTHIDSN